MRAAFDIRCSRPSPCFELAGDRRLDVGFADLEQLGDDADVDHIEQILPQRPCRQSSSSPSSLNGTA